MPIRRAFRCTSTDAKLLAAMRSGVSGSWAMVKRTTARAITLISRVRSTLPQAGGRGAKDGHDTRYDEARSGGQTYKPHVQSQLVCRRLLAPRHIVPSTMLTSC